MKFVSQLDNFGYFTGAVIADESPLEPGVFLIPGGAIDEPPPSIPSGKRAKWQGEWLFEDIPFPEPEPEPVPMTELEKEKEIEYRKRSLYADESDPLFFKWQAGEATKEEWLNKRNEIKNRDIVI
jgi:hypothetical protein